MPSVPSYKYHPFPVLIGTIVLHRLMVLCLAMLLGVAIGLLSVADVYAADTIHVKIASTGSGDGSDWNNATTLQNALQNLADSGEDIWVAAGVYRPGLLVTDTFSLPSGVAVYGGFTGTETERTQRDWVSYPTVLSGDIAGDDTIDASGVVTDTANIVGSNNYHVVFADGTGTPITGTTVLDGFTITAGLANGSYPHSSGGGLYCNGQSGGECGPSLTNVTFSANMASAYGGAMLNDGTDGGISSPILTNVIFSANYADTNGGALYNYAESGVSSPSLTNVTFYANSANSGGAMYNYAESGISSPSLTNVAFYANAAKVTAGAMFSYGHLGVSSPSMTNVTFSGNSADKGGALYNFSFGNLGVSSPSMTNVTFSANKADKGGAMYNDGLYGFSSPSLTNAILWGSDAISGTQIYNVCASPTITSSLVEDGISGIGIYNDPSSNVTDGGNNLAGGPADDPLFVQPVSASDAPTTTGNLRLQFGSPAIDVGSNSAITTTTDLDGNPRKLDGNGDGIITVDLGAYEMPSFYPLELIQTGTGTGQVAHTPTGIACSAPCLGRYLDGTVVTLTATVGSNSVFNGWSGSVVSDTNPLVITMDSSKKITATFKLMEYTLEIITVGYGSVSKEPDFATYPHSTVVIITATASISSTFSGWSGDANGNTNPLPVIMDGSKAITATFAGPGTGSVAGKVVDGEGAGVPSVSVTLSNESSAANSAFVPPEMTDAVGNYRFEDVPPGSYTLLFVKPGYETYGPITMLVQEGQSTTVDDIVMQKSETDPEVIFMPGVQNQ